VEVGQAFGHIDFLIHSIAYAPPQTFEKRFVEVARADFALALDISAYSLIALSRGVLPFMKDAGGCILAMTYFASEKVIPGYQVMSVAKAALDNIIRNLAYDLAPHRIRVNGLSPGPTATKAGTSIPGFSIMQEHMKTYAPLQGEIQNADAGKAALFLCSPLAEKITGEIVHVDGGYNILGMTI
jgi:enoyl-[acyl-carrier protein] reductase I